MIKCISWKIPFDFMVDTNAADGVENEERHNVNKLSVDFTLLDFQRPSVLLQQQYFAASY